MANTELHICKAITIVLKGLTISGCLSKGESLERITDIKDNDQRGI